MTVSWPAPANAVRPEVTSPEPGLLREPLLDLWRRNLPTASEQRCDWLYGSRRARAWLLSHEQSVFGAAGLMFRRMYVQGRCVDAGGAIDLNVDQAQRSVGPALALVRAVVSAADADQRSLVYGMPNPSATAVMKRAGYRELGEFTSWTKLIDCKVKLNDNLRSPILAKALAPLANKAMHAWSFDWQLQIPLKLTAQEPTEFDSRFDRLSEQTASRFDVIGERSADYLNWRFTECPDVDYQIFTLIEKGTEELAGYLVWYLDDGAVSISDILAADPATTLLLLVEFSRQVRSQNLSAIRFDCFAPPGFYKLLRHAGFHRRQNRHPVVFRSAETASDPGPKWYLTMADSDTDV